MSMTLSSAGPISPRIFNETEKQNVVTFLTFDLPYALTYIEGELPQGPTFPRRLPGRVIVESRPRSIDEIVRALS
jgi:hypothetical protein